MKLSPVYRSMAGTDMQLVWAGVIMFVGSLVQGAIGFGLGMIAVPLLVEAGFSLSQAVALTTLTIGIQVLFGAWRLRAHIPWDDVKPAALARLLTVALGVYLLLNVETMDAAAVKRLVGAGVLLGVIARVAAGKAAQREWPQAASIAAFGLSGILQGLVAMGGPPLVLWMTARDFRAQEARAFTMTLFLFNAPVQVFLLLFLSQTMNLEVILLALALAPVIYLGTRLGLSLGDRFSKQLLNRAALAVLVVIALNAMV
ncbi:MAG: sulfite exporter TauE/SafE family protein [Chloroflexota bacterium]|nr:sulfite exporter TauE/SafE family protein [Chloroflexota bacterium]MDE2910703.1 sulfite exporter TauE/SafE family protein [Chloroflexota bacterium]